MIRMRTFVASVLGLLLLAFSTRGFAATNRVVNFGKVNDFLYRGGQPDLRAIQELKALGVKSVINLRMTNDVWAPEPALAAASSITYTNIPLNPLAAPTGAQVTSVLAAISSMPKPVFIHCQHGCDRTGTIIALYRIREDRWPSSKALREAEAYGISPYEVEMRQLIKDFKP